MEDNQFFIGSFDETFGTPDIMTLEQAIYWLSFLKENYKQETTELKSLFGEHDIEGIESASYIIDGFQAIICRTLEIGTKAIKYLIDNNIEFENINEKKV